MATFEDGIQRNRKVEVVIQSSQVPGDLTNYEWTVTEANLPSELFDSDGANPAQNGGGDIRFSSDSAGSNQLAIDVVTLITDADPANGEAEINVLVPSVSGSVNTSIWVWYNTGTTASQPAPSHQFGSDNAYRSTAELVLTLNEDPAGAAPQFIDRTANGNDGTANGGMTSGDSVAGKVGQAVDFDGVDDYVSSANITPGTLTFSAWAKMPDSTSLDSKFVGGVYDNTTDKRSFAMGNPNSGVNNDLNILISSTGTNFENWSSGIAMDDGLWHKWAMTWDGTNVKGFKDGVELGLSLVANNGTVSGNLFTAGLALRIGAIVASGGDPGNYEGQIDDVRMHSEALSADYELTRHNNTESPGTFAVAGTPEGTVEPAVGPPKGSLALLGCGV